MRIQYHSPFAHEVVGFDRAVNVFAMNAYRHTHQHVLRTLSYATINTKQVRSLQSLESEA